MDTATLRVFAACALVLALQLPLQVAAAEPNGVQSGENSDCTVFNLMLHLEGIAPHIVVEGGTAYRATHTGGTQLYIDFYDAEGRFLGDNSNHPHTTPLDATNGFICVGIRGGGWPDVPAPGAEWTYQDGY